MNLRNMLLGGSERTANLKKNIWGGLVLKGVNILVSLLLVPLIIDYVNPTRYGIWITLTTVVGWIAYFDIGLNQGFKNRFAESLAIGDRKLAARYVSTTYALTFLIFVPVAAIGVIANQWVDWAGILKIDATYLEEMRHVFSLMIVFFCLNMCVRVVLTMLDGDQKTAAGASVNTLSQVVMLGIIWWMKNHMDGNLPHLAAANMGVPVVVILLASLVIFSLPRYREFTPAWQNVDFALTRNIIGLGLKFFVMMISMLLIFQFITMLITRNMGPVAVAQYNIAYKYFFTAQMLFAIVVTPFWPAFTEAFTKGDSAWMQRSARSIERVFLLCIPAMLLMLWLAPLAYRLWLGERLEIPFSMSFFSMLYVLANIAGFMYMNMLNGTGKVLIQTVIYVSAAIIAFPVMNWATAHYGIAGLLTIPTATYLAQALFGRIQLYRLIRGSASGIWNR
jgi:O-antigen/teichoic acid export membrane protein